MVCSDFQDLNARDIDAIALQTKQALVNELSGCLKNVLAEHSSLPLVFKTFGGGSWLAEEVIHATLNAQQLDDVTVTPFSNDKTVNQTAAALAVAKKRQQAYLQTRIVSNA